MKWSPAVFAVVLLSLLGFADCQVVDDATEAREASQPPPAQPPQIDPNSNSVGVSGSPAGQNANASAPAKCGTVESDYAACISKERADALFRHCCQQYAPDGCQSLCSYDTEELAARNTLLQAVKSGKCELKHMSTVLYCASQNQDNRKCCEHLNLSDGKLGVGNRCLRFCDPAGEGIQSISRTDVTCLFNWNVLMYCHHSGIKLE